MTSHMSFDRIPSLGKQYLRAAAKRRMTLAREEAAPRICAEVAGIVFPPKQLRGYRKLCHFADGHGTLPLPAPHLLTTPLHLSILTHPAFPLPAMGMVHASNTIKQIERIPANSAMDIVCTLTDTRWLENGVEIDIETKIQVNGKMVWEEVSSYFQRTGKSNAKPSEATPQQAEHTWRLHSSLGREYGAISGDRNPIHLWPTTARLFGFKRHIVHGMWTLARCVAQLESEQSSDACTLQVNFRRPCFLPCDVGFSSEKVNDATQFRVFNQGTGKDYLDGRLSSSLL